jgi:alpha-galactosidase
MQYTKLSFTNGLGQAKIMQWQLKALTVLMLLVASADAQKFAGLAQTPPMGWNTWNTFATRINEQLVHETADVMVTSGMREAGYVYVVLDDTWSARKRDADGNLVPDPHKFPSGMKALGQYLHNKGLKFGIYNCAGTKTCAGYPGSYQHERADAKQYAAWGVDYLKYDWCNTNGADPRQRYATMRDALHVAGRPIVFSMCEWGVSKPWTWAEDTAHLWRTTGDITDLWKSTPQRANGVKNILDMQVGLEKYAGPGTWNDPDMLEVGKDGLTPAESRAHFSLWCMLAAPLMAGNDLRKMSEQTRAVLTNKDVIALDQDPLGRQGRRVFANKEYEVWLKELQGGDLAACILNVSDQRAEIKFSWRAQQWLPKRKFEVRDLWNKRDLGTTDEPFVRTINSHDVALARLIHP